MAFSQEEPTLSRFEFLEQKMGVPVRLVFYAPSQERAEAASAAVFERFDALNAMFSDYDPESDLIQLCRQGGQTSQPIPINPEMREILSASRHFCELTGGAFDITVGPVVKLWRRSRLFHELPPEKNLNLAKSLVGNELWSLSDEGVCVLKNGVRFDLGGIAKGYAIDEGLRILQEQGISRALVDAGGDLRVGDPPPGKDGWTIGVASLDEDARAALYLTLSHQAAATSGDTFQFIVIDSIRYSHLIDPRSAQPLTRHAVVTVLAPDAMTADALASAVSVLGGEKGLELINTLPKVETLIFELKDDAALIEEENGRFRVRREDTQIYATEYFRDFLETSATDEIEESKNSESPQNR